MTQQEAVRILGEGVTPLDYLCQVMRGIEPFDPPRFEAAKAVAPYMHPRLAAVEHKGGIEVRNVARLPEAARNVREWTNRRSATSTH